MGNKYRFTCPTCGHHYLRAVSYRRDYYLIKEIFIDHMKDGSVELAGLVMGPKDKEGWPSPMVNCHVCANCGRQWYDLDAIGVDHGLEDK